jgi:lipoate---protein ligase
VNSNPSKVVNLHDFLPFVTDSENFADLMEKYFLATGSFEKEDLSQHTVEKVSILAATRYRSWEWNYAYGPDYQFISNRTSGGKPVTVNLTVKEGCIVKCFTDGQFFPGIEPGIFTGIRHMPADVRAALETAGVVDTESLTSVFF